MCQNSAITAPESAEEETSQCCVLCGNRASQILRYINVGATEREFFSKHLGKHLPEDSNICKKHWIEAKRYNDSPHYIPKWKNSIQASSKSCIHPVCTNKLSDKLI